MLNTTFLRLYILHKVNDIQKEADSLPHGDITSIPRAHELQGKLDLLKEMFEELELNQTKTEIVEYHDQI